MADEYRMVGRLRAGGGIRTCTRRPPYGYRVTPEERAELRTLAIRELQKPGVIYLSAPELLSLLDDADACDDPDYMEGTPMTQITIDDPGLAVNIITKAIESTSYEPYRWQGVAVIQALHAADLKITPYEPGEKNGAPARSGSPYSASVVPSDEPHIERGYN